MNNKGNCNRTPRLRFPGFEGEWEERKLGEVGTFVRGLSYNKTEVTEDNTETLVLRSNNIIADGTVDIQNELQFVTKKPSSEQLLQKGDVVICLANGSNHLVGKTACFDGNYAGTATIGAFCGIYRSPFPICKYLVQTDAYRKEINQIKQGGNGALANLYGKDILDLRFLFPSMEEQEKIASFLSELDRQIAAQLEKLEALKELKKGLMRQLFPDNEALTPPIRFKGFEGEWKEITLSNIFERVTRKNQENNQNVLTISAQYGLINQLEFFNKSVSATDVTGYYLLQKGEFAYNKSRSQGRPVGAIKPLKRYDKGVVSTLYICFKCKNSNEIDFWEQYFDAGLLDTGIMSIAQEGARNHGLLNVSANEFFGLTVKMPSLAEQQKIASCLSEMDTLIAAQQQEVDSMTLHKRGLMQQLFPQPAN